jgi:hypothetical protein
MFGPGFKANVSLGIHYSKVLVKPQYPFQEYIALGLTDSIDLVINNVMVVLHHDHGSYLC